MAMDLARSWLLVAALLLAGCAAPSAPGDPQPEAPPLDVFAGNYSTNGPWSRVLANGTLAILPGEVVTLRSALDGEAISMGVVRPAIDGRVPVIVHASPYFPPFVAEKLATMEAEVEAPFLVENFVPHGYAVVWIAVRGTGSSGGCWDWYGPGERADLRTAMDWLAAQSWAGPVGVMGRSFGADPAWAIAGLGLPSVRTIVPLESQPDAYSWIVRNGTMSNVGTAESTVFYPYATQLAAENVADDPAGYAPALPAAVASGRACPQLATALRDSLALTATPDRPTTGFFAERDLRGDVLARYRGSVLLAHAFPDSFAPMHLVEPFAAQLIDAGVEVKRVYGQWGHGAPDTPNPHATRWDFPAPPVVRMDWAELLLRWFDRHLKENASVETGPAVQVADSSGQWRSEDAWPPRDAAPVAFQLGADGALVRAGAAPGSGEAREGRALVGGQPQRSFVDRERASTSACAACPAFRSEAFAKELRFAGLPRLTMNVTPTGNGGIVTADLLVEDEAGLRARVGWGQIDVRYADGTDRAKPVTPGVTLVAHLELEPLDVVVPAGARLVLVLSQGGYGDDAFYYRATSDAGQAVHVELGGDRSLLTVLAFERDAATGRFFEPPTRA